MRDNEESYGRSVKTVAISHCYRSAFVPYGDLYRELSRILLGKARSVSREDSPARSSGARLNLVAFDICNECTKGRVVMVNRARARKQRDDRDTALYRRIVLTRE